MNSSRSPGPFKCKGDALQRCLQGQHTFDLSGPSSTTLNLMDNATVTGSVRNTSALFYYGTDINLMVSTDPTSSITRLGETR